MNVCLSMSSILQNSVHVLVKTVDSYVVVVAVGAFHRIHAIQEILMGRIWSGEVFEVHSDPVHEIATSLGPQTSTAFLFSHAFSGWDTNSSFKGKGKKSFSMEKNAQLDSSFNE